MNEKDASIRKQWLIVFAVNMANYFLWCALTFMYNPLIKEMSIYPILIGGLIGIIGVGFPMYHCIYKKPGVKFVTVLLATGIISLIANPILTAMGKTKPLYPIPFYTALQAFSYLLNFCWVAVCWRIRKVNQKLRLQ